MSALALSMGDPAGIGLDIALDAWRRRGSDDIPAFLLLGDPAALAERAKRLGLDIAIAEATPETAAGTFAEALPVFPVVCAVPVVAGAPSSGNAGAVIEAIRLAVDFTLAGRTTAVVTCPIAKAVLYAAGFGFPGHTEYLADLASAHEGRALTPVMLLAGPDLKVAPVTIHIPLAAVPGALTSDMIVEAGRILARDLSRRFAIARPRIAVSGLNPHAGENGALGREDDAVVAPAIAVLRGEGIDARGPLPADTMFHAEARSTYDAALCMYHDQALIPAKTLAFHDSVNVTLGLPFIRTSPDHGTAFSIAGKGVARSDSLIAALKLARAMAQAEARGTAVAAQ